MPHVVLWFAITACSGQTIGLPNFPRLIFNGRVVSEAGAGISAEVVLNQRWPGLSGPCSPNGVFHVTAQTAEDGSFQIVHYPSFGIDGCFILKAYTPPDTLPADSLVLTFQDLLELGDPVSEDVIVVEVEIVIRQ